MTAVEAPKNPVANWETVRDEWVGRLATLVSQIEQWAKEAGWSTRRLDRRMHDSQIGEYKAPALLLQVEFTKIALEPIGRFIPDAMGAADLYLMPAYDDIASLYDTADGWEFIYRWPGSPKINDLNSAKAEPLSKETIQRVLEQMRKHAAGDMDLDSPH
jgi:hypothetical protein